MHVKMNINRYVGLIFDNSLRWNTRVKQLKAECNSRMNLLKHLTHIIVGGHEIPQDAISSSDQI